MIMVRGGMNKTQITTNNPILLDEGYKLLLAGGLLNRWIVEKEKVSDPGQEGKPGTLTFWRLQ